MVKIPKPSKDNVKNSIILNLGNLPTNDSVHKELGRPLGMILAALY